MAQPAMAIMPISRQSGYVGDDRVTAAGQAIEQGRLAHIGPADQYEDGLHR
jgi:hypothetical protein